MGFVNKILKFIIIVSQTIKFKIIINHVRICFKLLILLVYVYVL